MVLVEDGLVKYGLLEINVSNIVVMVSLDTVIDLEYLSVSKDNLVYEPKQFTGLIFKPEQKSYSVLVFQSGKLILAGLRSVNSIKKEIEFIIKDLNLVR